jgi:hypothetical protein
MPFIAHAPQAIEARLFIHLTYVGYDRFELSENPLYYLNHLCIMTTSSNLGIT